MVERLFKYRNVIVAVIQAFLLMVCYYIVFLIRFDFATLSGGFVRLSLQTFPVLLAVKASVFHYFRLFSDEWNSEELNDVPNILKASVVSSVLFVLAIFIIFGFRGYPRSAFVLDFILTAPVIVLSRYAAGVYLQRIRRSMPQQNTLLVSTRPEAAALIPELNDRPKSDYQLVGLIDPEANRPMVEGVEVLGGFDDLNAVVNKRNIARLLIPNDEHLESILARVKGYDLDIQIISPNLESGIAAKSLRPQNEFLKVCSVLFVNRVYPPVLAATGQILAELADQMKHLGWQVTVVTSQPETTLPSREVMNGIFVERVQGIPFSRKNILRRALSYFSLYPAIFWRILSLSPTDVLITMTDPPLIFVMGAFFKLFRKFKLVHWAQDIYPEIAVSVGVIKKGKRSTKLLEWVSSWGLRQYDQVICIGRCMHDRMLARGIDASALTVIPNWADTNNVRPLPREGNPFRETNNIGDRPVVMYSGNLGVAHPFDAILDAAQLLQQKMSEALLLIVGDGPRLADVQERVERDQLTNVQFFPLQPHDKLTESLSAADLHLACMYDELCGLVVPSKVYGILAAGRPCLFIGPDKSEAARVILENNCGSVLPANLNGNQLADAIVQWLGNSEALAQAGSRARAAAEKGSLVNAALAFDQLLRRDLNAETVRINRPEIVHYDPPRVV